MPTGIVPFLGDIFTQSHRLDILITKKDACISFLTTNAITIPPGKQEKRIRKVEEGWKWREKSVKESCMYAHLVVSIGM